MSIRSRREKLRIYSKAQRRPAWLQRPSAAQGRPHRSRRLAGRPVARRCCCPRRERAGEGRRRAGRVGPARDGEERQGTEKEGTIARSRARDDSTWPGGSDQKCKYLLHDGRASRRPCAGGWPQVVLRRHRRCQRGQKFMALHEIRGARERERRCGREGTGGERQQPGPPGIRALGDADGRSGRALG